MRIGIVLSTDEPELAWNALRFGNLALQQGHAVQCFLLARGVRLDELNHPGFDTKAQLATFAERGGVVKACGTCLDLRGKEGTAACPMGRMQDLLDLATQCDRVLCFG